MTDTDAINTVLSMPRELRVRVLEQLLASLEYDDDFHVPQHVIDDCESMIKQIEAGTMKTYSWEEVKASLEASRRAQG